MPNLVHGRDPGGAIRPIEVDENGNLRVDLVSGVSVSTEVASGTLIQTLQLSGSADSVSIVSSGVTLEVVQVSGSSASVNVLGNVAVTSANTLEVVQVSGSSASVNVLGNVAVTSANTLEVVQVSGSAFSSEVSGVARQTNPTAVADGATVKISADDLGRVVITPYQVRDLVSTAYLATSTGIETTLLAAVAGVNLDLMQVVCANTSDAIVDIDFRSVTAGSIEFSITVPADSTAGFVPAIPWPQVNTGNNWTADVAGADISNTVVNISALFVRNI